MSVCRNSAVIVLPVVRATLEMWNMYVCVCVCHSNVEYWSCCRKWKHFPKWTDDSAIDRKTIVSLIEGWQCPRRTDGKGLWVKGNSTVDGETRVMLRAAVVFVSSNLNSPRARQMCGLIECALTSVYMYFIFLYNCKSVLCDAKVETFNWYYWR